MVRHTHSRARTPGQPHPQILPVPLPGDSVRHQHQEPGRVCWPRFGSHTGPGWTCVSGLPVGAETTWPWGSYLSKNHAWPLLISRQSPLLRSGVCWEAICPCRAPQYAMFASPHLGEPWWSGQDSPSSWRHPHRLWVEDLNPLTCLTTDQVIIISWAPGY